jgi:hypothetical protein
MEFTKEGDFYRNGFGELVELEDDFLYPMLKSSEVANAKTTSPHRWMLVTQECVGAETSIIRELAPLTWKYLDAHGESLDARGSSIYRNRPRFSVFGVGEYTFSPWKVAISGFYKRFAFVKVGPIAGRPIVLDDTCYSASCRSEDEADYLVSLLNSEPAVEFLSAQTFWDAKRPITIATLSLLDVEALAKDLGSEHKLAEFQTEQVDRNRLLFR